MTWECLHSVEQSTDGGTEQADGHGLGHVLRGQVENAGRSHQVDAQGRGMALHRTEHQLQETEGWCHQRWCFTISYSDCQQAVERLIN